MKPLHSDIRTYFEDSAEFERDLGKLRADPDVELRDFLEDQVKELFESRNPTNSIQFATGKDSYSACWVYFPWRKVAVRTLRKTDYRDVRTNRNQHLISKKDQQLLLGKRIAIAGLSVGASIATTMVLEGCGASFHLADFDVLGLSNLNRLWGSVCDLGVNKARLAGQTLLELDPYLEVTTFEDGVTEANLAEFLSGVDVLIEECDSLQMKVRLREQAKKLGIPVIMQTSEGGFLDVERFDVDRDLPIFHGRLDGVSSEQLTNLRTREKVPYVMAILGLNEISAEFAASLIEVESSLKTWPQRGSAVVAGAAMATVAARTLLLDPQGNSLRSGRYQYDVAKALAGDPRPPMTLHQTIAPQVPERAKGLVPALAARAEKLNDEQLRWLIEQAGKAPSAANAQPWHYQGSTSGVTCVHHHARGRTHTDLGGRAAWVAIGASVETLSTAASVLGFRANIERLSPSNEVHIGFEAERDQAPSPLAQWIDSRRTERSSSLVPTSHASVERLMSTYLPRASMMIVEADRRRELSELAGLADRARFLSPELHRELMGEVRFGELGEDLATGIALSELGLSDSDRTAIHLMRRRDVLDEVLAARRGFGIGRISRELVAGSDLLILPAIDGPDALQTHFDLGRALVRFWLAATGQGIAVYPLGFPYFLQRVRFPGHTALEAELLTEAQERFEGFAAPGKVYGPCLRLAKSSGAASRSQRLPLVQIYSPR
jgi:tRNA A37 threonylcarbamoyladenosine dehydratase